MKFKKKEKNKQKNNGDNHWNQKLITILDVKTYYKATVFKTV